MLRTPGGTLRPAPFTQDKKYEFLVEPSNLETHEPDFHTLSISLSKFARFSCFFSLLQNLPDFHTFSFSFSKLARFSENRIPEYYPLGAKGSAEGSKARKCEYNKKINLMQTKFKASRY